MIYYFDKYGREHKVPQVVTAMSVCRSVEQETGSASAGNAAMHEYLQACAARGEISKADAFWYEHHLNNYLWEE